MEKTIRVRLFVMTGMVLGAALLRLLPHPHNFTPIAAMALFAGAHYDRKWLALVVPISAMLLSDAALELLTGRGFHSLMPAVYGAFLAVVGLGLLIRRKRKVPFVLGAALAGSLLFFIVTNFAVWTSGGFYPMTLEGLLACYVAGIPFFGNTVLGDLFYTGAMFGSFAFAERKLPVLRLPSAEGLR